MAAVEVPASPIQPSASQRGPHGLTWPAPHHMRVIDEAAGTQPERGLVTFHDGAKLQGLVVHVDFDEHKLAFRPDNAATRVLPFSGFRTLFLVRTIELEPIPLAVPPGSLEARPSRENRKCTVTFNDASILEAEIVSAVRRRAGLFLFVAHYADEFLRWFIPAEVLANYRIGEPLGKALRDREAVAQEALEEGLRTQQRLQSTKLGDYLADRGIVTREQLESALIRQKTMSHLRLGDALVQEKLITAAQRDEALAMQATDRRKLLGEILVEAGVVSREEIRRVLAEQLGVPSVNLASFQYDPNAIKAVSADLARKYQAMPLYRTNTRIAVGIENPLSWEALQELEFYTGLKVDPAMAAREELETAIAQFYGRPTDVEHMAQIVEELGVESRAAVSAREEVVTESDNTLVRFVNKMIMDANDQNASDIHIESMQGDKASRVRLRIDGVLVPYVAVPSNFRAALVSRLKIMAVLDIAERRRPQDGKIRFEEFGPRKIELRVVTMPTAHGLEDVVMRILSAPRALTLEQLALCPKILPELKAMAARSFGLVIVCGPTGSGKTTTLHSLLSHINTPQRKIWTVEDPIEISQDGLCQVQVNAKLGLTFPAVLRSFLRADPDVIMVGEMRDAETARTVVSASLTGHLVLSTMHTNSAVESITRLLDLGLDPFNFSDAVLGIVGQRLVRRLCAACRIPQLASAGEIDALAQEYCRDLPLDPATIAARWMSRYSTSDGAITLQMASGCPTCDRSGYKGRMGVHELLIATPAIKAMIQARATPAELLLKGIEEGMVTLKQDAIEKVLQGHLDLKQVLASCH